MEMREKGLDAEMHIDAPTPAPTPAAEAEVTLDNNTQAADACAETSDPALDMAGVADAAAEMADGAEAEMEVENEEAAAEEAAERPDLRTKEEVMAAVTELAARDAADIAREEIARMKQRFYAIRKTELDAELEAYIAEGNPAEEFKPALDPAEEEFKTLLNNIKEKKAVLAASPNCAPYRRTPTT